ncbi:MAG: hypothetical protein KAH30_03210 [Caldisericia bacterium]|nr:hypothetical protein [Caldisericia bacterium]
MKCRKCGWNTPYPICPDCATEEEKQLLEKLSEIDSMVAKNKKKNTRLFFKFPEFSPLFIVLIIIFFLAQTGAFYLVNHVDSVIVPVIPFFLFGTFMFVVAIFWGEMPQVNIDTGINTINAKAENLTMRRHKKKYLQLLKKPYDNWHTDDRIVVSFKSMES